MQKKWIVRETPPQSFLQQHPELPPLVANLLYHRGVTEPEKIDEFLNPDYTQDIFDPYLFLDMQKAIERINRAIEQNEKITIHGDYDADGVCAATILMEMLYSLGHTNASVFLPHRETDGYGLNKKNVQMLADTGTKLIITCDCGVSNTEEITLANTLGVDVIVTDHHALPAVLPPAVAIIHPKREGETYPDDGLCGAGVAFKLLQGMFKKHKETHTTLPNGETHDAFEKWLIDLVAIASVSDMVPLLGESRTLTKYGLLVLNKTRHVGLQKLLTEAKLIADDGSKKKEFDATTISFQIAPRLNAAGRMNHANVAYNLLFTKSPIEATDLAFELNNNNIDRQKLTEQYVKEACEQVEKDQKESPVLFVKGYSWSAGIVGLIASKLKEKYQKPVFALTHNDGYIVGSGRSIDIFNMIATLQEMPQYFLKFGGHPQACGFTLASEEKYEEMKKAFIEAYYKKTEGISVEPTLMIDAELSLTDVNWDLYDVLDKFKPFGQCNEKPRYLAKGVTVHTMKCVGNGSHHLSMMVKHNSPKIHKTIGWGLCGSDKNPDSIDWTKQVGSGDLVDIVFEVDVNEWNGNRELQLTIVDLRKHE